MKAKKKKVVKEQEPPCEETAREQEKKACDQEADSANRLSMMYGNLIKNIDPWIHRSKHMRCKSCMYFVPKVPAGEMGLVNSVNIGRCRRHAPSMNGYPVVFTRDFCGDHKLDENKI